MKKDLEDNGGYPKNPEFKAKTTFTAPHNNAYIFDIDGTLAFMDGKRGPFDYDKVEGDRCNVFLLEMLKDLARSATIIICSGRDEECRKETEAWLEKNGIGYDEFYMRKAGDNRKDSIVKKELYMKHIKPSYNVIGVFDDRNQVVDMWRLELGLPTYQVWYGNF